MRTTFNSISGPVRSGPVRSDPTPSLPSPPRPTPTHPTLRIPFYLATSHHIPTSSHPHPIPPPSHPTPGQGGVWKEGVLRKRGEKAGLRGLQKRLFVLRTNGLYYYDGDKTGDPKGKIPLVTIQSLRLAASPDGPTMEIDTGMRVFLLVARRVSYVAEGWVVFCSLPVAAGEHAA